MILERILSCFENPTDGQKTLLSALFHSLRKGHLAIDSSQEGLDRLCHELGITEKEPFLSSLHAGCQSSFIDRSHREWVIKQGPFYSFQKQHALQQQILENLKRLTSSSPSLSLAPKELDSSLNEQQRQAIDLALSSPISLITGGPGTGKSFTAAALIQSCSHIPDLTVIVGAPTGKAAFHLASRLTGNIQTGTLHSLLGIGSRPKFLAADLILIDESSMIDAEIFSLLLKAIPLGCRLILIGDKEQLPPVGCGSIFADLIEFSDLPCTHLSHSLRTDSAPILELARKMITNEPEEAHTLLIQNSSWIAIDTAHHFYDLLLQEFRPIYLTEEQNLPKISQAILCCMRQGPLGSDAINEFLFSHTLKQAPTGAIIPIPLLITANHHHCNLYNGDQGVLLLKQGDPSYRKVFFQDRTLPLNALSSYSYNFALSIHKSQGSEYEDVLIVAPPGSEVFGREVLYTAVTRAKKKVRIASTLSQLKQILATTSRKTSALSFSLKQKPLAN